MPGKYQAKVILFVRGLFSVTKTELPSPELIMPYLIVKFTNILYCGANQ